jgi:hypothetical protein
MTRNGSLPASEKLGPINTYMTKPGRRFLSPRKFMALADSLTITTYFRSAKFFLGNSILSRFS